VRALNSPAERGSELLGRNPESITRKAARKRPLIERLTAGAVLAAAASPQLRAARETAKLSSSILETDYTIARDDEDDCESSLDPLLGGFNACRKISQDAGTCLTCDDLLDLGRQGFRQCPSPPRP
jgi:hypothetical protein